MIQEIDVPEGKDLMPYFTDSELTDSYVKCYASFVPIKYEVDENGEQVLVDGKPVEVYTEIERARQFVTEHLDKIFIKWQRRQAANSADIISGGIS
jgi:hypothetical protein